MLCYHKLHEWDVVAFHNESSPEGAVMKNLLRMVRRDGGNPANWITILRLLMALGLPYFILNDYRTAALVIFVVAALTDKLDGWLAKKITGTTELGKILDPLVDKVLMGFSLIPAFILSILLGTVLVAWMLGITLMFLAIREWSVFRLKLRAHRARGVVDSAIQSGRISMVVLCTAIGFVLIPIDGGWMDCAKAIALIGGMVFSGLAWIEYHRAYAAL